MGRAAAAGDVRLLKRLLAQANELEACGVHATTDDTETVAVTGKRCAQLSSLATADPEMLVSVTGP